MVEQVARGEWEFHTERVYQIGARFLTALDTMVNAAPYGCTQAMLNNTNPEVVRAFFKAYSGLHTRHRCRLADCWVDYLRNMGAAPRRSGSAVLRICANAVTVLEDWDGMSL
jgi:hypothetical protein